MRIPLSVWVTASAAVHALVLWSGGSSRAVSPRLAVPLGEISVEIVPTRSMAPASASPAGDVVPPSKKPERAALGASLSAAAAVMQDWLSDIEAQAARLMTQARRFGVQKGEADAQKTPSPSTSDAPKPEESSRTNASSSASAGQQQRVGDQARQKGVRTEARLIGGFRPAYPEEALRQKWEGKVRVEIDVSADGKVVRSRLARSSGHAVLDNAAVSFAKSVQLDPAMEDGRPVPTTLILPVSFRLD